MPTKEKQRREQNRPRVIAATAAPDHTRGGDAQLEREVERHGQRDRAAGEVAGPEKRTGDENDDDRVTPHGSQKLRRHESRGREQQQDVVPERSESEPTRIGRLKEVEIVVLELEERQDGRAGRPTTRPHSRVYNVTRHFCAIRNRH